ncbi:MAG: hypothetical protein WDN26_08370 [Chitinophagaceae bacterium]
MFTFDVIGAVLLFTAFLIEFILTLLHSFDNKKAKDMMANCSLGLLLILTGLFEKGLNLVFSHWYTVLQFSPPICRGGYGSLVF